MSDDYEIGYGKPPKHSQFEPGKSGNPRGRPRGARGLKSDLLTELSVRHTIHVNGKPMRGNRQQLILRTLAARAANGNLRAQALILPLIIQALGLEDRSDAREKLSISDQALLDELLSAGTPAVPDAADASAEDDAAPLPGDGKDTGDA